MESCKPWKMALIAMAGPLCNALIVLCFLPLVKYNPYEWLCVFLQANLVIAIFNLMPAFPLDGGRVLVCMLFPVLGQTFAERICSIFGMLLGLFFGRCRHCVCVLSGTNQSFAVGSRDVFVLAALRQGKPSPYAALVHEMQKKGRFIKTAKGSADRDAHGYDGPKGNGKISQGGIHHGYGGRPRLEVLGTLGKGNIGCGGYAGAANHTTEGS